MDKIIVTLTLLVLGFGVTWGIMKSEHGLEQVVREGQASTADVLRQFDYVSE
jgi:hypothetical protein